MSEIPSPSSTSEHGSSVSDSAGPDSAVGDSAGPDLEQRVGEWLTVPDIAEQLGVPLSVVRRWIEERDLLAHRLGERRVVAVPARFVDDEGPVPALRGTFTVLGDGGMSDDEVIAWLFEPDDTLPVEGAPIDALLGGFKTEVRRRAMETAF